jgi:hypothetical protein
MWANSSKPGSGWKRFLREGILAADRFIGLTARIRLALLTRP